MNLSTGQERRRFFDDQSADWDQREAYARDRDRLTRIIPTLGMAEGTKVLDVGTGTGIAARALRMAVGPTGVLVGLDLSMAMIRKAKEVNPCVVRGDCHALPFLNQAFDYVFACAVVPHLDNISRFFKQSARVLAPNGQLIILHCLSREMINDIHRKASPAVEKDTLPAGDSLALIGKQYGIIQYRFEERDNLFLWVGNYAG